MNILVAGAAGMIGSHLCDYFLARGHKVIGVDNFITGSYENISHLLSDNKFSFINWDVTDPLSIKEPIDWIMHFASPASPVAYTEYPLETIGANTTGTQNLLELAKKKKAKLFYASTSEVYGDPQVHPQPESYYGNVSTIGPRACYDESKRLGETLVQVYTSKYKVPTRTIRIFNTYSHRLSQSDGRVISNFVSQAIKGDPLTVYGTGLQTRSLQHVRDLIRGIDLLMNKDYSLPVNLGNPEEYTVIQIANIIKKICVSDSRIIHLPTLRDDPKQRKPDITLASKMLGWAPQISLEDGLRRVVAEYAKLIK